MGKTSRQKVVIIGCGNVAWHIAKKLSSSGSFDIEVYNHRVNERLQEFRTLKCKPIVGLNSIREDASWYFICVPDRFIGETAKLVSVKNPHAVLMHTSGSTTIKELGDRVHGSAVFYPLQTFSRANDVNWSEVPLVLEADDADTLVRMVALSRFFGERTIVLDYPQRLRLHLAAVMVNNFVNALYVAASGLLEKEELPEAPAFDLLLPLIRQTTQNAVALPPVKAQTGPAKRNDTVVMEKHLKILRKHRELRKLYKLFGKIIADQQQKAYEEF